MHILIYIYIYMINIFFRYQCTDMNWTSSRKISLHKRWQYNGNSTNFSFFIPNTINIAFNSPLFMRPPLTVYTSISFVNTSVFLYALVNLLWYICNLYRIFSQFGWIQPHFEPSMFTILQRLPILFSLYIPHLSKHPVISSTIFLEQSS